MPGLINISWTNVSISSSSQLCTPQLLRKQTWIQILTIPLANSATFGKSADPAQFSHVWSGTIKGATWHWSHDPSIQKALQEYQPCSAGALTVSGLSWRCSQFRVEATVVATHRAPGELPPEQLSCLSEQREGQFLWSRKDGWGPGALFHTLKNDRLKFRVSNLGIRLKWKACFNKPLRCSQHLSRILRAPLHLP